MGGELRTDTHARVYIEGLARGLIWPNKGPPGAIKAASPRGCLLFTAPALYTALPNLRNASSSTHTPSSRVLLLLLAGRHAPALDHQAGLRPADLSARGPGGVGGQRVGV